jgi:hypothetical protein
MTKLDDGRHRPYRPKPFAVVYIALVVLGAGIAAAAYIGILWIESLPVLATSYDEKQAQARLEAVKVALTTVAGLAAVSGLYVAYRRQRVEESNSSREQDRVFTERFGAAAGLLASDNAAVRLAGVQSLARLADDSDRDRYTCLSALCSYLRLPVRLLDSPTSSDVEADTRSRTTQREQWHDIDEWDVRRNALKLLLERLDSDAIEPWDLRDAVLIEPDFSIGEIRAGLDARRAIVVGNAELPSRIFGSTTRFDGTLFDGTLTVIGPNSKVSFNESTIKRRFTFNASRSYPYEWGLMPTFERCKFMGGADILSDLERLFLWESELDDIVASNITLKLSGSAFFGDVALSSHAVDVAGADFTDVDELALTTYDGNVDLVPLTYDSTTRWPEGFSDGESDES